MSHEMATKFILLKSNQNIESIRFGPIIYSSKMIRTESEMSPFKPFDPFNIIISVFLLFVEAVVCCCCCCCVQHYEWSMNIWWCVWPENSLNVYGVTSFIINLMKIFFSLERKREEKCWSVHSGPRLAINANGNHRLTRVFYRFTTGRWVFGAILFNFNDSRTHSPTSPSLFCNFRTLWFFIGAFASVQSSSYCQNNNKRLLSHAETSSSLLQHHQFTTPTGTA